MIGAKESEGDKDRKQCYLVWLCSLGVKIVSSFLFRFSPVFFLEHGSKHMAKMLRAS